MNICIGQRGLCLEMRGGALINQPRPGVKMRVASVGERQGAVRETHVRSRGISRVFDDTCSIKTVYKEATVTLSACHIPHTPNVGGHTRTGDGAVWVPALPAPLEGMKQIGRICYKPVASEELVFIQGRQRLFSFFEHDSKVFIFISEGYM